MNTKCSEFLYFTFVPIQSFISQARRTRDLWAGSYLLSYLSGIAMNSIGRDKIVFPEVTDDKLLDAISGQQFKSGKGFNTFQITGSLPTRFMANATAIDAQQAEKALKDAWERITESVWQEVDRFCVSKLLWKKQLDDLWDIYWVVGEYHHLDQRKNIRNHISKSEKGEKCSVCGERQEISERGMGDKSSRQAMRKWWTGLAKYINEKKNLTLRTNVTGECSEYLCAVCLTKRIFPLKALDSIGWEVPTSFPSVMYMAASGWIKSCIENAPVEAADFAQFIEEENMNVRKAEAKTRLPGISNSLSTLLPKVRDKQGKQGWLDNWHAFVDLDGSTFFEDAILGTDLNLSKEHRSRLIKKLKVLQKASNAVAPGFYAILFMDGDSMSNLLANCTGQERKLVSSCIMDFSRKVFTIVRNHDGWLIYAGGEDVFALFSIDTVIPCAVELKNIYEQIFSQIAIDDKQRKQAIVRTATISAAINFISVHTPLQVAVRDTAKLLEDYAKDHMGRDTLACRVWKGGGPILTWSLPWSHVLSVQDGRGKTLLDEIKNSFQNNKDNPSQFSSQFFYKLRDLFDLLEPPGGSPLAHDQAIDLLAAEYLGNRDLTWPDTISDEEKWNEAKFRVGRLLALCRQTYRQIRKDADGLTTQISYRTGKVRADGALLVRFIAQKGLQL